MGKYENVINKYNEFRISGLTWNDRFELSDGSYSISHIQNYFEYIFKRHEAVTENPPNNNKFKQNRK